MSLAMTVVSARNAADSSVIDRVGETGTAPAADAPAVPGTALPTIEDLVPQTDGAAEAPAETPADAPAATTGDAPATPPRAD